MVAWVVVDAAAVVMVGENRTLFGRRKPCGSSALYTRRVPLTVIRKPGAAAEVAGGSHPNSPPASDPQRTLTALLELAYGDPAPAHAAIAHALAVAGRDELPASGSEIVAFFRAYLLTPLTEQIGARLTVALVEDLVEKVGPPSPPLSEEPPPSSMPRPIARITARVPSTPRVRTNVLGVLLVDGDRVGRTSVARALLREHWDVTVIDTMTDLAGALDSGDPIDVAVVDAAHPATHALLEAIARSRPDVIVVARSADAIRARAQLIDLGIVRFDVRSREAPAEELVDAIKRAR